MEDQRTGEMLRFLRTGQGIRQETLCRGLCSRSVYSKYESGERHVDRLLLDLLLQRMGRDSGTLSTVLTLEEYRYFRWKKKALDAVAQQDAALLRQLLQCSEALEMRVNRKLQLQFVYRLQACISLQEGASAEEIGGMLEKALEQTLPESSLHPGKDCLIGVDEMYLLLQKADLLLRQGREKDAGRLLSEIISYAKAHYEDSGAKIKVLPKAAKLLYPLLLAEGRREEGLALCREAAELLCYYGILYDLAELLEGCLQCGREILPEEAQRKLEQRLNALRDVYEEYRAKEYRSENIWLFHERQEIYLLDEIIRQSRIEQELSQETLSEGICSPETLSRIETGNRAPNARHFRALMQRLKTTLDYYNGLLETDDPTLLELQDELRRAMFREDKAKARRLFEDVKRLADMECPKNRRTLQIAEIGVLFLEGRISPEELIERSEKLLDCEHEAWRETAFWNQFFVNEKVRLMNYIAYAYNRIGQREKSIDIREHLLEKLQSSKVCLEDQYRSGMLIIGNLAADYGLSGRFEDCQKMSDRGIAFCLACGMGMRLGEFLSNKAEAWIDMTKRSDEHSRRYLQLAFYINDLMGAESTGNDIRRYYEAQYGENMEAVR